MELTKEDSSIAKGIAIVLMVVHHLYAFPDRIPSSCGWGGAVVLNGINIDRVFGGFGKICVPMFLFLSGYGLFKSTVANGGFMGRYKSRLLDFYLFFWVNLIFLVILTKVCWFYFPGVRDLSLDLWTMIENITLCRPSYSDEWWFGRVYCLCLLFIWPILHFTRGNNALFIFTISLILWALSSRISIGIVSGMCFWQIPFVCGYLFASKNSLQDLDIGKYGSAAKVAVVVVFVSLVVGVALIRAEGLGYKLDYLFSVPVIIFGVAACKVIKVTALFNYLGGISGHIWLNHTFVFYYIFPSQVYSAGNRLAVFFIAMLGAVILAIITSQILNYCLGYMHSLKPERSK